MPEPYKITEVRQYTETVYYNSDGTEAERLTNYDDHLCDIAERSPATDEEIEDYDLR